MSYNTTALAGTWDDVLSVGKSLTGDPYLGEFACEMKRLSNLESGKPAGQPCRRTIRTAQKGVGLRYVVGPVRLLVYQKQHPWFVPLVGAATVGLIFMLGYTAGKGRK